MRFLYSLFLLLLSAVPAISYARPVDTSGYATINGIRQFFTIKGADDTRPLLLFLHGGPGRSLLPFAETFTQQLQQQFLVVQWDQRETGKTLEANPSVQKLSAALLQSDALAMVHYLLKQYRQPKLYLVSHSWGSVQGFHLAEKYPQLLYAYVPISPLINATASARLTTDSLRRWARQTGNDTALSELHRVHLPYRTPDDLFIVQKWLFAHNGVEGVQETAFRNQYYQWMNTWFPVWKEAAENGATLPPARLECPVYFFEGRGDIQAFNTLVQEAYRQMKAPRKHFTWFGQSGHTIFNTEPEKIQRTLIETVLRETRMSAATPSFPSPTGRINDFEDLFSPEQEQAMAGRLETFTQETGITIAVVTLDSSRVQKADFEYYTLRLANAWGVGKEGKDNGILIAISRGLRTMHIHNGFGIEQMLSDEETKAILEQGFIPHFKTGDYYEGTQQGLSGLLAQLYARWQHHH